MLLDDVLQLARNRAVIQNVNARAVRLDFDLKAARLNENAISFFFKSAIHGIFSQAKNIHVTVHFKAQFKGEFLRAYSQHLEVLIARIIGANDVFGGIFGNVGAGGNLRAFPGIYGRVIGFVSLAFIFPIFFRMKKTS